MLGIHPQCDSVAAVQRNIFLRGMYLQLSCKQMEYLARSRLVCRETTRGHPRRHCVRQKLDVRCGPRQRQTLNPGGFIDETQVFTRAGNLRRLAVHQFRKLASQTSGDGDGVAQCWAYDDWWFALGWVRDGLLIGAMLRDIEVKDVMPRVTPWKG